MKLSANRLVKSYRGRKVLDGVSYSVEEGEVVGLLGPNGAGKTTSFYITVGLVETDSGNVSFDGNDVTALPMFERARLGVGYLAQEPSVFRKLSVEDNIKSIIEFLPDGAAAKATMLERLLKEFGVEHVRKSKAYSLSGGERRRVEIARSLVNSPRFLLLDEPFSGIDPKAVADIQEVVIGLKKRGIGILITDHNVGATLGICDRAYIIDKGAILETGTPLELVESRRVRDAYLGDKFRL
ncbi:MAG: LPS export ABC transporter ATP-binding protein [Deltaproteobacteria bacterium]|nr:LPS export ABC transporter ATP-binding protein [Deltaproteobacteria bacterium]